MGGNRFYTRERGKSLNDAYRKAVEKAEDEHGHQQGYSGEINSTCGTVDLTKNWKDSKLDLNKFIDTKENNMSKGTCYTICTKEPVVNNNKIKSTVDHFVEKGTKKWILKYVVTDYDRTLKSFLTKAEAVRFARAHTEKTFKNTQVNMVKELEKGSTLTATIKYKPGTKETEGEYVFFGIAPC
jgi:hypothetical protein